MDNGRQMDERRRRLGAWYTPPEVAAEVMACSLDPWLADGGDPASVTVLDPACGDGNLLAAAADRLVAAGLTRARAESRLIGLDLDADALRAAADRLPDARLVETDGLTWELDGALDVVVANPPFLSPLRRRTAHAATPGRRYADGAALFLERWAPRAERVGFVMPLSFLATADAAPIRQELEHRCSIERIVAQTTPAFDAAVYTCVIGLRRGTTVPDHRPTWSHRVAAQFGVEVVDLPPDGRCIGDVAEVRADFRDQYYGLVGAVHDGPTGPPLVTSGLIGDGVLRWGTRPVRFAKQRWSAPRVELDRLDPSMQAWARRRLVPKVLVATQADRIHAVADPDGELLPGVPVISVIPHDPADLPVLTSALADPHATAWARCTYLGAGLTPRSVKLSARQVAALPLRWGR